MALLKPPKNPVTLAINGWLIENYLDNFFKINLPAYEPIYTSEYRTPGHNKDVGGGPDSTHVYNLGRDFALKRKADGIILSDAQAENVFNDYFKTWEGFAKFYPTGPGENSHHIHAHIDRDITTYTKYVGIAAIAAGAAWAFNKYKTKFKQ